ncbi:hypothetical protein AZ029_003080, partial [Klebsiella pneumoniae]
PTPPTGENAAAVYPRWRGEHRLSGYVQQRSRGLSPLARGTPSVSTERGERCRFIPAGAGNTCQAGTIYRRGAVYPRWRGEHVRLPTGKNDRGGLSPLARGTHPAQL